MAFKPPAALSGLRAPRIVLMLASWYIRFTNGFRTVLRSIGLGILTYISSERPEPSKVLVDRSLRLALARCLIHLLPAVVSMFLVVFNIQGWFIGSELQGIEDQDEIKMGLLQISAKLQELLIVASLGSVVFHVIRWELAFGSGLPLGLIVSGWRFTDLSYFWSADFMGGIFFPEVPPHNLLKRWGLVALVVVSGGIAVTAGPAAAVLMIPRRLEFPIGGAIFWLKGSDEQIWPTVLNSNYYAERNCSGEQGLLDYSCPSYGVTALINHYSRWWNYHDADHDFQLTDFFLRKVVYVRPASHRGRDTWVYTTHGPSARMLDAMQDMHAKSLKHLSDNKPWHPPWPRLLNHAEIHSYELETKVPAVRTACVSQGMVDLNSGNLTVGFLNLRPSTVLGWPAIPGDGPLPGFDYQNIDVLPPVRAALSRRGILQANASRLDEPRLFNGTARILAVPISIKKAEMSSSLGLVLFMNRTEINDDVEPFNVATCSIDARWAKGKSIIRSNPPSRLLQHEFVFGRVRNPVMVDLENEANKLLLSFRGTSPDDELTEIEIQPSWYDLFAPVISSIPGDGSSAAAEGPGQTTMERILSAARSGDREYIYQIQHTIASAIADGLSRSGSIPNRESSYFLGAWEWGNWKVQNETLARSMLRNGGPTESFPLPAVLAGGNSTRMEMQAKFTGYAMVANGWFDYFCIVVLMAHAVIALGHTIFVCWRRETSGAWDTILEFIALAHKSPAPPDPILSNTSAGVSSFKTIGAVAWVEVSDPGPENSEQLRLRFKGDAEKRDEGRQLEKGVRYNRDA